MLHSNLKSIRVKYYSINYNTVILLIKSSLNDQSMINSVSEKNYLC